MPPETTSNNPLVGDFKDGPKILPPPSPPAAKLFVAPIQITITKFRNLLDPLLRDEPLSDHTIKVANNAANVFLKSGTYQPAGKDQTIRVPNPGAIIRFEIVGAKDEDIYYPLAVAFARADETRPAAVFCRPRHKFGEYSPFSDLEVDGSKIQFTDTIVLGQPGRRKGQLEKPTHLTYKFSILVQRQFDGALGLIDPYVENDNSN